MKRIFEYVDKVYQQLVGKNNMSVLGMITPFSKDSDEGAGITVPVYTEVPEVRHSSAVSVPTGNQNQVTNQLDSHIPQGISIFPSPKHAYDNIVIYKTKNDLWSGEWHGGRGVAPDHQLANEGLEKLVELGITVGIDRDGDYYAGPGLPKAFRGKYNTIGDKIKVLLQPAKTIESNTGVWYQFIITQAMVESNELNNAIGWNLQGVKWSKKFEPFGFKVLYSTTEAFKSKDDFKSVPKVYGYWEGEGRYWIRCLDWFAYIPTIEKYVAMQTDLYNRVYKKAIASLKGVRDVRVIADTFIKAGYGTDTSYPEKIFAMWNKLTW